MARLLGRIADAFADFWLEKEGYALLYLVICGALVNLVAVVYGVYQLAQHVRFV